MKGEFFEGLSEKQLCETNENVRKHKCRFYQLEQLKSFLDMFDSSALVSVLMRSRGWTLFQEDRVCWSF